MARTLQNARIAARTTKGRLPAFKKSFISTGRKIAIRAMLDHGMSQFQVSVVERLSKSVINSIAHDEELDNLEPRIFEKTKRCLANRFYLMADKSLDRARQDDRMEKMSSYQLAMISAVSVDKARLLDGLSTDNFSVRGINDHILKGSRDLDDLKRAITAKISDLPTEKINSNDFPSRESASMLDLKQ